MPHTSAAWRELIAVILLSVTAIATAWTGFQVVKWGGVMAISFSEAGAARIEASRAEGVANRQLSTQTQIYTQWIEASAAKDTLLADYISERFPEPLHTAWVDWMALDPLRNPDAPKSPFDMPSYVLPDIATAQAADARANDLFARALVSNQRGDDYAMLTVLFATVLFFAAVSGRVKNTMNAWILLGIGLILFSVAGVILAFFPKLV